MATLLSLRHLYYFIQAYITSTKEQPVKYKLTTMSLVYLCVAMAYILSVFFTGIKI